VSRQRLTILGATGSIGVNTLDVLARHPDRFEVVALTGHRRLDILEAQCRRHRPRFAVVSDAAAAKQLAVSLADTDTEVLAGAEALAQVAALPEVDTVMAAIVGAAGLPPALAAIRGGKKVLLANKESLVMAGGIFMAEVLRCGATLLPIDSEHNAIFQSLPHHFDGRLAHSGVRKILLTASGGPFRTMPIEQLAEATPEQACAHPNWIMGKKISVDSATMMNKGLEVIEAHWLFNANAEQIEVVIHPQSIVHSLVQYVDGSVVAELGNPDMRAPIAHALAYPERIESGVADLDLISVAQLDFERPDMDRFPCLRLAYQALAASGNAPAVLNAANELAVTAFLNRELPFLKIADVIAFALDQVPTANVADLDAVMQADRDGRSAAATAIRRFARQA
jgi:1-deoxy-D-xylulose-5-phosphate reductoisomerase